MSSEREPHVVLSHAAVLDCVQLSGLPQPIKRQPIGNQIDAAIVFTGGLHKRAY